MKRRMKLLERLRVIRAVGSGLLAHESAKRGARLGPLSRFVLWQARKRLTSRPRVVRAFGTGQLVCYPDSSASNAVVYFGYPDWNEMRFLRRILRPGDGFIDAGANVGVYSVLAATRVMPGGRVVAIEPEPLAAVRLRQNFSRNGLSLDDVHAVALGEGPRRVKFRTERDTVGRVLEAEEDSGALVEMCRLDDLLEGPSLFVLGKLDLEGYELQALRGATRLLERGLPSAWLVETNDCCEAFGTSRVELQDFLREYGYALYRVEHDGYRLRRIARGGPYPQNALATRDPEWLLNRCPRLEIVGQTTG
jgi:FkbM family methyltransferase